MLSLQESVLTLNISAIICTYYKNKMLVLAVYQ